MSDPERLLSGTGAEQGLEREVLSSLRLVSVPTQAKAAIWGAISSQVLQSAAAAAPASLWQVALKATLASKATLAVPIVAVALAAGVYRQRLATTTTVPAAAPAVVVAAVAPSTTGTSEPKPSAAEPAEAAAPVEHPAAPAPRKDGLARESALLTRARAELRAGNAAAAQSTLSHLQKEFGAGALRQEREVLTIEALAAQGNASAAGRRAAAFIAEHPESPHASALRRFVAAP